MFSLVDTPLLFIRRLTLLTLYYLATPVLLFFLGWLKLVWGIPCTLLVCGTLLIYTTRGWKRLEHEKIVVSDEWRPLAKAFLWTWVPVALMVLQIGVGGLGLPTYDWNNKHNLIFADLVRFSWPVIYHDQGTPATGLMMVYYIAYYLPGAAVAKVGGWVAGNIAWHLWTQLGFMLVCAWLVAFAGARVRWLGILFLGFGGAEFIGFWLHKADVALHLSHASGSLIAGISDIARWNATESYYVLYRSNIVHLFWAPQHLIAAWLGLSLCLSRWNTLEQKKELLWDGAYGGSALPGWCLLVFFSPLSALGCLPFLLALLFRSLRNARGEGTTREQVARRGLVQRAIDALPGVASLACIGVLGLYLAARTPLPIDASPTRGAHLEFLLPSLWRDEGWHALWRYGGFVLVEFGLMSILVWPRRTDGQHLEVWRAPLAVGLVVLLILPCFLYGYYNDLAMRASIPSMAVLCLVIAILLQSKVVSFTRRLGVVVLLCCGALTFYFYSRASVQTIKRGQWSSRRSIISLPTIVAEYRSDPHYLLNQYTGPTDSPFARVLAK